MDPGLLAARIGMAHGKLAQIRVAGAAYLHFRSLFGSGRFCWVLFLPGQGWLHSGSADRAQQASPDWDFVV
jgi:hypothetical protein